MQGSRRQKAGLKPLTISGAVAVSGAVPGTAHGVYGWRPALVPMLLWSGCLLSAAAVGWAAMRLHVAFALGIILPMFLFAMGCAVRNEQLGGTCDA